MKILRRTASWGICILIRLLSLVQRGAKNMPQPYADQAKRHRRCDVHRGLEPLTVSREVESLQTEGRKRSEASADARHDKLPHRCADEHPAIRPSHAGEQANEGTSDDIHDECAPGKCFSDKPGRNSVTPISKRSAKGAAECDPQVCQITPLPVFRLSYLESAFAIIFQARCKL